MSNLGIKTILSLLILNAFLSQISAQTYTWTGDQNNDWSNYANWQEAGGPPWIDDNVRILNNLDSPTIDAQLVIVKSVSIEKGELTIEANGTLIAGNSPSLAIKVNLQGAYNATTGIMNAALKDLVSFPSFNSGYTMKKNAFDLVDGDVIVDWLMIELRSETTRIETIRPALLQADGDVVDMDGVSPLQFPTVESGQYYVVVQHRNHLSIMSNDRVELH